LQIVFRKNEPFSKNHSVNPSLFSYPVQNLMILSEVANEAPSWNFALSFCIVWLKKLMNHSKATHLPCAVAMFWGPFLRVCLTPLICNIHSGFDKKCKVSTWLESDCEWLEIDLETAMCDDSESILLRIYYLCLSLVSTWFKTKNGELCEMSQRLAYTCPCTVISRFKFATWFWAVCANLCGRCELKQFVLLTALANRCWSLGLMFGDWLMLWLKLSILFNKAYSIHVHNAIHFTNNVRQSHAFNWVRDVN